MELTKNKKAYFDYEILESQEAGIELQGHEVKSVRAKQVNLKGSYVSMNQGQLFLKGMNISPWKTLASRDILETQRPRKIFLHKKKILYFGSKVKEGGYTILATEIYLKGGLIKVRVALAKGKKSFQKKQSLKERSLDKEAKMMLKKNY
ncbi:SsrA-binding protein SmpB [Candidatus Gracilibacteria bacterium]|nr:SsrA-binding protein SmpB [Candidatus Gracilibacteria bacterium]